MPTLKITNILAIALLGTSLQFNAFAAPLQELTFTPNQTYTINTALGVITQIELSPHEDIKDFGTGMSNGWDLVRRDNIFYLKPKNSNVDTNLIIRTAAHQYIFELKVVSTDWKTLEEAKKKGVNYHVTFRYPDNTRFKIEPSTLSQNPTHNSSSEVPYHTDYDAAADKESEWLIPLSIYDDGKFTYIHLQDGKLSGNFPAVFGRKNLNGEEFVVNSNVENQMIIVHGIYPFLVLRNGNNVVGLRRN